MVHHGCQKLCLAMHSSESCHFGLPNFQSPCVHCLLSSVLWQKAERDRISDWPGDMLWYVVILVTSGHQNSDCQLPAQKLVWRKSIAGWLGHLVEKKNTDRQRFSRVLTHFLVREFMAAFLWISHQFPKCFCKFKLHIATWQASELTNWNTKCQRLSWSPDAGPSITRGIRALCG